MIYYQIHPLHGYHISYSIHEVKQNETKGWRSVTEAEFYDRPKPSVARNIDEDIEAKYFAKYGKKPHHRMKQESIEAALNDDSIESDRNSGG